MAKKKTIKPPNPPPPPPPEIDYSKEKLPDDMERWWSILVQLGENTPEKREAAYQAERIEADRQLELLAVELEYNKKFYKKYGRYPYYRREFYRHGTSASIPNAAPIKNAQKAIEDDEKVMNAKRDG